jgi:hypothetical protein
VVAILSFSPAVVEFELDKIGKEFGTFITVFKLGPCGWTRVNILGALGRIVLCTTIGFLFTCLILFTFLYPGAYN